MSSAAECLGYGRYIEFTTSKTPFDSSFGLSKKCSKWRTWEFLKKYADYISSEFSGNINDWHPISSDHLPLQESIRHLLDDDISIISDGFSDAHRE